MRARRRPETLLAGALLAGVVLAALAPVVGNGFVNYDDDLYVTENEEVRDGPTMEGARWAFTTGHAANWHPLTWLSHMLDWRLFGESPAGHHGTSLLLHVAGTLAFFAFLRGATGSVWRSALAAALFGIHPLHVESVAWIAERKDVLSGLLAMLALLAYLRYARSPRLPAFLATAAALALGLLAKPMLVTLPFLFLLADAWPLERRLPARRLLAEKVPLLALAAAAGAATLLAQRSGLATGSFEQYPLGLRAANAVASCADYLARTVRPRGLAVFYPYPAAGVPLWKVAASAFLLAALTAAAVRFRRRFPYLFFGWLWYAVSLLPVIGLVQVGEQASADRYTYLPLAGIFVAAAWGGRDLAAWAGSRLGSERGGLRLAAAAAAAVVVALALLARGQAAVWKDSFTLFEHALAVTRGNHVAHLNLGLAHAAAGRRDEAIRRLEEAVRLRPDHPIARSALGEQLGLAGRRDEAIRELEEAVRLDGRRAEARAALALQLALAGRIGESLPHFQEAARRRPGDAGLLYNWGTALAAAGRYAEAAERFRDVLRLDPRHARARQNLGAALARLGEGEAGEREIRDAREMEGTGPR